jgi:hypothetical protein
VGLRFTAKPCCFAQCKGGIIRELPLAGIIGKNSMQVAGAAVGGSGFIR